jgi:hypothetical protein
MKKAILIVGALAIICTLVTSGIYHLVKSKQTQTSIQQSKAVIQTTVNTKAAEVKTLVAQKVNLQKALIASKAQIAKMNLVHSANVSAIKNWSKQVKQKPQIIYQDVYQDVLIENACDSLVVATDILVERITAKDSLYATQQIIYDALLCTNDTIIKNLQTTNTFLVQQTDTLMQQLNISLKENTHLQKVVANKKSVNKFMCGSLLAIGTYSFLSKLKIAN